MNLNQMLLQALGPIFIQYWWLWLLLAVLSFLKTPFMKGVLGEFQVNLIAKLRLDKQVYTLFKNVTLPTEDGGTTQIDHVSSHMKLPWSRFNTFFYAHHSLHRTELQPALEGSFIGRLPLTNSHMEIMAVKNQHLQRRITHLAARLNQA